MMDEQYFVITNSDGDTSIDALTSEELKSRLTAEEGEDGACYYGKPVFKGTLPSDQWDTNYWGENEMLIIKGRIVVPEPETVVETYKLP